MAERSKASDCKSDDASLRRFESYSLHHHVVIKSKTFFGGLHIVKLFPLKKIGLCNWHWFLKKNFFRSNLFFLSKPIFLFSLNKSSKLPENLSTNSEISSKVRRSLIHTFFLNKSYYLIVTVRKPLIWNNLDYDIKCKSFLNVYFKHITWYLS